MLRFSKWSLSWTDNSEAADDRPWSSSGRNHDTDSAVSTLHGHHRRVQCLRGQWVDFSVCLDLHSGLSAMNWSDDFLFCVLWAIKGIDTIFISAIAYASQWPNWIIFGQNTLSICIYMQNFGYLCADNWELGSLRVVFCNIPNSISSLLLIMLGFVWRSSYSWFGIAATKLSYFKILSSTLVCFCLSDWSHGSRPFTGLVCSSVLCFLFFFFSYS